MSKAKKSRRRSPAEIQKILSEIEASGQSRVKYSADNGIPLSTIHNWFSKARPTKRSKIRKKPGIAKVISVGSISGSSPEMEIEFPNGVVFRFGSGCQVSDLRLVLQELGPC